MPCASAYEQLAGVSATAYEQRAKIIRDEANSPMLSVAVTANDSEEAVSSMVM